MLFPGEVWGGAVSFGTPPVPYTLVFDTGWVQIFAQSRQALIQSMQVRRSLGLLRQLYLRRLRSSQEVQPIRLVYLQVRSWQVSQSPLRRRKYDSGTSLVR